jgi:hypothetical protein
MNSVMLREAAEEMGPLHLDQTSLAAALDVTQAALSQWIAGRRATPDGVIKTVAAALEAGSAPSVRLGSDARHRSIVAPAERWEPVFRPTGRFRLPLHLEWSGSARDRWRDADRLADLLGAYARVIDNGGAADAIRWLDPALAAAHWGEIPMALSRRGPWERHLTALGYQVAHAPVQ